MNTVVLHHRVSVDDIKTLDGLAGKILSRQAVATMILGAALEAIRKDPDKLKFPPAFAVAGGAEVEDRSNRLNQESKIISDMGSALIEGTTSYKTKRRRMK